MRNLEFWNASAAANASSPSKPSAVARMERSWISPSQFLQFTMKRGGSSVPQKLVATSLSASEMTNAAPLNTRSRAFLLEHHLSTKLGRQSFGRSQQVVLGSQVRSGYARTIAQRCAAPRPGILASRNWKDLNRPHSPLHLRVPSDYRDA